jgi:hypothetical protein
MKEKTMNPSVDVPYKNYVLNIYGHSGLGLPIIGKSQREETSLAVFLSSKFLRMKGRNDLQTDETKGGRLMAGHWILFGLVQRPSLTC